MADEETRLLAAAGFWDGLAFPVCPACGGVGHVIVAVGTREVCGPCRICNGTGRKPEDATP